MKPLLKIFIRLELCREASLLHVDSFASLMKIISGSLMKDNLFFRIRMFLHLHAAWQVGGSPLKRRSPSLAMV